MQNRIADTCNMYGVNAVKEQVYFGIPINQINFPKIGKRL